MRFSWLAPNQTRHGVLSVGVGNDIDEAIATECPTTPSIADTSVTGSNGFTDFDELKTICMDYWSSRPNLSRE